MTLLLCPDCDKEISHRAAICPFCGYMATDHLKSIDESLQTIKIIVIVNLVMSILGVIWLAYTWSNMKF
jgi:predicted amidophosphoribosyltransferase